MNDVKTPLRRSDHEHAYFVKPLEVGNHLRQRKVSKHIRVVDQKTFFSLKIFFNGQQTFPQARINAGIGEGNRPVINVLVEQVQLVTSFRINEIIGEVLVIIDEIIFDAIPHVTQAQNEILVTKVGVIFHDVPDYRTIANRDHRLRNLVGE